MFIGAGDYKQGLLLLFGLFALVLFVLGSLLLFIMRKWQKLWLFYVDLLLWFFFFLIYNGYSFGFTAITYIPLTITIVLSILFFNFIHRQNKEKGMLDKYFWTKRLIEISAMQVIFFGVYYLLPS